MAKKPQHPEGPLDEEDWEITLSMFRLMRSFEDPSYVERYERLIRVLREDADAVYRAADSVERGREFPEPRLPHLILPERLERARLTGDKEAEAAKETIAAHGVPSLDPTGLRSYAHFVANLAIDLAGRREFAATVADNTLADGIRKKGHKWSASMDYLLRVSDHNGFTDVELARRLVAAGIMPEWRRVQAESDPVEQWCQNIRAARSRRKAKVT